MDRWMLSGGDRSKVGVEWRRCGDRWMTGC